MAGPLYVTDLDGTLLASDGRVSPVTADILQRVIASGAQITYATARSFHSARPATGGCGFRIPVVVYGGAFLVDPTNGAILSSRTIAPDAVAVALERAYFHGLPPLVFWLSDTGDDRISWVVGQESPGVSTYVSERRNDPRFAPVASDDDISLTAVFYISIIGDREPLELLASEIRVLLDGMIHVNIQADNYHPEQIWLEITDRDANKAAAIRKLAHMLAADRIVSFGDNTIDLPLFEVSDESYAVSNAIESVRSAASAVIGSNDSDAVARWLQEHAVAAPGT